MKTIRLVITVAALAAVAVLVVVPRLGSDVSDSAAATTSKAAVCAALPSTLDALLRGGTPATRAANIVAQTTSDPNLKSLASAVASNPADAAVRNSLATALQAQC